MEAININFEKGDDSGIELLDVEMNPDLENMTIGELLGLSAKTTLELEQLNIALENNPSDQEIEHKINAKKETIKEIDKAIDILKNR